jgi:hypothetical protein
MAGTEETAKKAAFKRRHDQYSSHRDPDLGIIALQKEAERRERILAERRRTASKWRPKIPEVRKVNFEHFKNRFQDVEDPDYAIDVLMAGSGIQGQIRRELGQRRREAAARRRQFLMDMAGRSSSGRQKLDELEKAKLSRKGDVLQPGDTEIQRIRIQSQPVLGHLTSLLNDTEVRSTPRTFVRPFKALIYFQPKMKEILATLEEKWADVEDLGDEQSEAVEITARDAEVVVGEETAHGEVKDSHDDEDDAESLQSVDSNAEEDFDTLMDSPEALRDMRCYVNFIDEEVMPLYNRFDGSSETKVKFEDLWYLFRPGDLIYMPATGESGGRYHEVWRVYSVTVPRPATSYKANGWEFFSDDFLNIVDSEDNPKFKISAYYIDHDGSTFGAVTRYFDITSFVGERQIDSLDFFPIRFRRDHKQLIGSLQKQGQVFLNYLDDRHQQYSAWTLTRNPPHSSEEPDEEILDDEDYNKMRHPEFIESDVIVDLTEAYQKMPGWRPCFCDISTNTSIICDTEEDEISIQHWFERTRHSRAYEQKDLIQKSDGVEARQRRDNFARDAFLWAYAHGYRTLESKVQALKLRDEDLLLLPKRMFAYALRERRFLPVDLNLLKPVRREAGVFENLRIQREYKDVVRGLVMSHFQKKMLERKYADAATEGPSQDLIQGKGRGLVVLLHGVPGVGKTATAEAVAMENHKPLFVITCGDLGLTPSEVESSLKNVFRLAHLWDCVLLLDEADVFLSQRSKQDMKRNALVSVFLRVLEYYNGLLFLTTNRVGTIDEAFKSRIHISLYYVSHFDPSLALSGTVHMLTNSFTFTAAA